MPGNVLLQGCTRHTRTLHLLTNIEACRYAGLRGLGSFTEAIIGTKGCALGERARSRCTPESWQTFAIGASPRNRVTQSDGPCSTGAREVTCRHRGSAS
jgi:hypothetical protein